MNLPVVGSIAIFWSVVMNVKCTTQCLACRSTAHIVFKILNNRTNLNKSNVCFSPNIEAFGTCEKLYVWVIRRNSRKFGF